MSSLKMVLYYVSISSFLFIFLALFFQFQLTLCRNLVKRNFVELLYITTVNFRKELPRILSQNEFSRFGNHKKGTNR